jgi:hypothetical protein
MTYEEFLNFVHSKCLYETIYDDSDGNTILIIKLADAVSMVNKAQRWVGLTDEEIYKIHIESGGLVLNGWEYERAIESALREKNGG